MDIVTSRRIGSSLRVAYLHRCSELGVPPRNTVLSAIETCAGGGWGSSRDGGVEAGGLLELLDLDPCDVVPRMLLRPSDVKNNSNSKSGTDRKPGGLMGILWGSENDPKSNTTHDQVPFPTASSLSALLVSLAEHIPPLLGIDLSLCELGRPIGGGAGCMGRELARGLELLSAETGLKYLNLAGNGGVDAGMGLTDFAEDHYPREVLKAISKCRNLEFLDLSGNWSAEPEWDGVWSGLAEVLDVLENLRTLSVSALPARPLRLPPSFRDLFESIGGHGRLERVRLGGVFLDDDPRKGGKGAKTTGNQNQNPRGRFLTALDLVVTPLDALTAALSSGSSLRGVELFDCEFGNHSASAVLDSILSNHRLCSLSWPLSAGRLPLLKCHPGLSHLDLSCSILGPTGAIRVSELVSGTINSTARLLRLRTLRVRGCGMGPNGARVLSAIRGNTGLVLLDIADNAIGDDLIAGMAIGLGDDTHLESDVDTGSKAVARGSLRRDGIPPPPCALRFLSVSGNRVTTAADVPWVKSLVSALGDNAGLLAIDADRGNIWPPVVKSAMRRCCERNAAGGGSQGAVDAWGGFDSVFLAAGGGDRHERAKGIAIARAGSSPSPSRCTAQ